LQKKRATGGRLKRTDDQVRVQKIGQKLRNAFGGGGALGGMVGVSEITA